MLLFCFVVAVVAQLILYSARRFETELRFQCFEQIHTEKLENSGAMHHVNVWAFDLVIRQSNTQFTVLKCRSNLPFSLFIGERTCCVQIALALYLIVFNTLSVFSLLQFLLTCHFSLHLSVILCLL